MARRVAAMNAPLTTRVTSRTQSRPLTSFVEPWPPRVPFSARLPVMRIRRRKELSTAAAPIRSDAVAELDRGAAILEGTPWSGWRRFESELRARSYTPPAWMPGWMGVAPDAVPAYCAASSNPVLVAALLSMHQSGYVRERAVDVLADSPDPLAIPALILRSTDWVPQVRDPAARRLGELQTTLGAGSFLPALPMLEPPRWSVRARGEILDALLRWVLDELPTDQLIAALSSSASGRRKRPSNGRGSSR